MNPRDMMRWALYTIDPTTATSGDAPRYQPGDPVTVLPSAGREVGTADAAEKARRAVARENVGRDGWIGRRGGQAADGVPLYDVEFERGSYPAKQTDVTGKPTAGPRAILREDEIAQA